MLRCLASIVLIVGGCGRVGFDAVAPDTQPPRICDAIETCNGIDDDCNGLTDEGCACVPFSRLVAFSAFPAPGVASTTDGYLVVTGDQLGAQVTPFGVDGTPQASVPVAGIDLLGMAFGASSIAWSGAELAITSSTAGEIRLARFVPETGEVVPTVVVASGKHPRIVWDTDRFDLVWIGDDGMIRVRELAVDGSAIGDEIALGVALGNQFGLGVTPHGFVLAGLGSSGVAFVTVDRVGGYVATSTIIDIGIGSSVTLARGPSGFVVSWVTPGGSLSKVDVLGEDGAVLGSGMLPDPVSSDNVFLAPVARPDRYQLAITNHSGGPDHQLAYSEVDLQAAASPAIVASTFQGEQFSLHTIVSAHGGTVAFLPFVDSTVPYMLIVQRCD